VVLSESIFKIILDHIIPLQETFQAKFYELKFSKEITLTL